MLTDKLWFWHSEYYQGNVENWLMELLNMTRSSVHSVIRSASITIGDPTFKLLEFEGMFPSQVYIALSCYTVRQCSIKMEIKK